MAWDLQQDLTTGDLAWNTNLDLAPVVGEAILAQRIATRIKVDYGSYVFDRTLGSRLRSILNLGVPYTPQNVQMLIYDALQTMNDIVVTGVDVVRNGTELDVTVSYQSVLGGINVGVAETDIEQQTTVTLPG